MGWDGGPGKESVRSLAPQRFTAGEVGPAPPMGGCLWLGGGSRRGLLLSDAAPGGLPSGTMPSEATEPPPPHTPLCSQASASLRGKKEESPFEATLRGGGFLCLQL